jgi:hypothetical protein
MTEIMIKRVILYLMFNHLLYSFCIGSCQQRMKLIEKEISDVYLS